MNKNTQIDDLRSEIRLLEKDIARDDNIIVPFGISEIDDFLSGNGLMLGKVHEVLGDLHFRLGNVSSIGFVVALLVRISEQTGTNKEILWCVKNKNIARGNIKEGCEQIKFIDASIKDSYLEKFKIYCLIFNDKKPEAQLLLDLLREQKQSSKFYDDKINFLLGVTNKTNNKINEKNLLNFYLSSITIADFKYEPTKKN